MDKIYEPHYYQDPKFPVIFHLDTLEKLCPEQFPVPPHWHENIEILYFIHGECVVTINTEDFCARAGDIVVIPSNALHRIRSDADKSDYYCLIPDRDFCDSFGFQLEEICFKNIIRDSDLNKQMDLIVNEFETQKSFYKAEILSGIISFLVYLTRNYLVSPALSQLNPQSDKLEMVKRAFTFIEQNYSRTISTDEISAHTGFSKYYFCHVFKEITNMTPVAYINYIRCKKAKELLTSGRCNVSETAVKCGFENLSYFTKTYKKYIGSLPSKTID